MAVTIEIAPKYVDYTKSGTTALKNGGEYSISGIQASTELFGYASIAINDVPNLSAACKITKLRCTALVNAFTNSTYGAMKTLYCAKACASSGENYYAAFGSTTDFTNNFGLKYNDAKTWSDVSIDFDVSSYNVNINKYQGYGVQITVKGEGWTGITRKAFMKELKIGYTRTRACYIKFTGDGIIERTDTLDYGSIPSYGSTPSRSGYIFRGWNNGKKTYKGTLPQAGEVDVTYTAVWVKNTSTVTFHYPDGTTTSSTKTTDSAYGALPKNPRKEGYIFAGWYPGTSYGESMIYNGSNYQDLGTDYPRYTDKISVHLDAYRDDWSKMKDNTEELASCAQAGGWKIGYDAGDGTQMYISKIWYSAPMDFSALENNQWHTFDMWFDGDRLYAQIDNQAATSINAPGELVYGAANIHMYIGAEAGSNGGLQGDGKKYLFKGMISNLFIANSENKLEKLKSTTVVTGDADYYPCWRISKDILNVYLGENPVDIYVGNSLVDVYIGTTKIYGEKEDING